MQQITNSYLKNNITAVNIFHKPIYNITSSPPTPCKTYCFAFPKRLFCKVKA